MSKSRGSSRVMTPVRPAKNGDLIPVDDRDPEVPEQPGCMPCWSPRKKKTSTVTYMGLGGGDYVYEERYKFVGHGAGDYHASNIDAPAPGCRCAACCLCLGFLMLLLGCALYAWLYVPVAQDQLAKLGVSRLPMETTMTNALQNRTREEKSPELRSGPGAPVPTSSKPTVAPIVPTHAPEVKPTVSHKTEAIMVSMKVADMNYTALNDHAEAKEKFGNLVQAAIVQQADDAGSLSDYVEVKLLRSGPGVVVEATVRVPSKMSIDDIFDKLSQPKLKEVVSDSWNKYRKTIVAFQKDDAYKVMDPEVKKVAINEKSS